MTQVFVVVFIGRLSSVNYRSCLLISRYVQVAARPDITALADWAQNTNLLTYLLTYSGCCVPCADTHTSLFCLSQYVQAVVF